MNEKLKKVLSSLENIDPTTLPQVQNELAQLVPSLNGWEKQFAASLTKANSINDVFKAAFQLLPEACFKTDGDFDIVFKPIFISHACATLDKRPPDFYQTLSLDSKRFRQDKTGLSNLLTQLKPNHINYIFLNARDEEVKLLFECLNNVSHFSDSETKQTTFLAELCEDVWIRILNQVSLESLDQLNWVALAKKSTPLNKALQTWLSGKWNEKNPAFWNFIQKQQILTIPGLIYFVISKYDSVFWDTFRSRNKSQEPSIHYCLMQLFCDHNAPFPFDTLNPHDQLLAYGLLMVEIGRKKQLFEAIALENQESSPLKVDLEHLERLKTIFLIKSPWLTAIHQAKAFPTELVSKHRVELIIQLSVEFQLSQEQTENYLEIAGCLPESPFTLKRWMQRYQKGILKSRTTPYSKQEMVLLNFALCDEKLSDMEIKTLAKAIETDEQVNDLYLFNCVLNEQGVEILCKGLKKNKSISHLTLSHMRLRGKDFNAITETIKINKNLQYLSLNINNLGREEISTLAEAIATHPTLEGLNLSENPLLGDEATLALLSESFVRNNAITLLDLSHCKITDTSAKTLLKSLERNSSLISLDLSNNDIQWSQHTNELQKSLENNTTLRELKLLNNNIQFTNLKRFFRSNTTLIKLDLNILHRMKGKETAKKIWNQLDKLLSRNRAYFKSHQKIDECLVLVSENFSKKKRTFTKRAPTPMVELGYNNSFNNYIGTTIAEHLSIALEEALKLYYAVPRYAHAEKLLHKVYCKMAAAYVQLGDPFSFIALYFHHFISHPDPAIDFELADLLMNLEDKTYEAVELNSENKKQLILSVLNDYQTAHANILRTRALDIGKRGIPNKTSPQAIENTTTTTALLEETAIQSLLKKLSISLCAIKHDTPDFKTALSQDLSELEINFIFTTIPHTAIEEYFEHVERTWESEADKIEFLGALSTATWTRFLNQLNLETLATFNLAALVNTSGELRDALAEWLIPKLKSPSPEFLAFAREQRLFSIPHLSDLIWRDSEIQKQFVEYGLFSYQLGEKIQLLEGDYSDKDDVKEFKNKLAQLENEKVAFFSRHPWLRLIHDEAAFPTHLFSILEKVPNLPIDSTYIKSVCLATMEKLSRTSSVSKWAKQCKTRTLSKNHLTINTTALPLNLRNVRHLSQLLKSDTSLEGLTLPISSKTNMTYLVEGLLPNTTLKTLDLSYSKLDSGKVMGLAKLLKENKTICKLNLSHSNLSNEALEILAEALKTNTTLKELVLDDNALGDKGITRLAKTFEENQSLTRISLAENGMSRDGLQTLANAFKTNGRTLSALNLNNNGLTIEDTDVFAEALTPNILSALKQRVRLEKDAEFLNRLNESDAFSKLVHTKSYQIQKRLNNKSYNFFTGQSVKKNTCKLYAIDDIRLKIYYHNSQTALHRFTPDKNDKRFQEDYQNLSDQIDNTTLQDFYNYIRDRKEVICASTRGDDWLTWFPRGKVDSIPLYNEIMKMFLDYDANLEANYLESKKKGATVNLEESKDLIDNNDAMRKPKG